MKRKDIIKSLIAMKQDEIPFNVIQRDMELPLDSGQIITVPGVRRCGKSSLMMLAINRLVSQGVDKSRILWIGFDDERLYGMGTEGLDDILSAYMEVFPTVPLKDVYMFFDEIQLVEKWELFILRVYKSYCKNIFVSGSNAQMLSGELSSALRGWPLEYEAYPLSFNEFCRFNKIDTSGVKESDSARLRHAFADFNSSSAFPEIVLTPDRAIRDRKLQGYFNTMLFRDLIEHYELTNHEVVRYFLKRLLANISKPTSVNSIYKDIKSQGKKISKDKLYELADYVCEIFLFHRIGQYSKSIVKESNAPCKYYCIDNGLRNAVLMPQSGDEGKLLENTVLLHLLRNGDTSVKVSFFRNDKECDFVLQRGDTVSELMQVTWDMTAPETRKREIEGLLEASRYTGCDMLTIITADEADIIEAEGKTITVWPAWKWLLHSRPA